MHVCLSAFAVAMNVPVGQLAQLSCPVRGFVVPAVITNVGSRRKVKVSDEVLFVSDEVLEFSQKKK